MSLKQKLLFIGIILIAVFFRYYLIKQMPGGLWPDEAANGLDIGLMQRGDLQPFYTRGNGREALFFYLEWASVSIFGKGVWQFHIVSAMIGVLAVILCYFVTYRLLITGENKDDPNHKKRAITVGLLAMFLMSVSTWHVVLSRTALRANTLPLFAAMTLYFLLRTYQAQTRKTQMWFAVLTGASFALGFYTYIAYRIMAPILFMIVAWPLLAAHKQKRLKEVWQQYRPYFWAFLVTFVVVVFPIADWFVHNPSYFTGRSGQVSIFNQTLYLVDGRQLTGRPPISVVFNVFWVVLFKSVEAFFIHGDLNWRQNISGFPMLSPLISPFFGVTLVIVSILGIWYFFAPLKKSGYWKYYVLTGWFWGMLLPAVSTAESIPHGLRSIGTITPAFILAALGLYNFSHWIVKNHHRLWNYLQEKYERTQAYGWRWSGRGRVIVLNAMKLVVACFCVALILQTYFLYFVYAYNDSMNFYAFRSDLTVVSQYLIDRCAQSEATTGQSSKNSTYLALDDYSVQTPEYLTSNRYGNTNDPCADPYIDVDPNNIWQQAPLQTGQVMVFTQGSVYAVDGFVQHHPEVHLKQVTRNKFGEAVLAVYEAN